MTVDLNQEGLTDVLAPAEKYYTSGSNTGKYINAVRTVQPRQSRSRLDLTDLDDQTAVSSSQLKLKDGKRGEGGKRIRRGSHDEKFKSRKFLVDVEETHRLILEQEDTDGDCQITINDMGPKTILLGTADSGGHRLVDIRGNYMVSNLLQELTLAREFGRRQIVIDEARLNENPVDRLSRMIKHHFWDGLTRRIDANGLEIICADPKNRAKDQSPRIYVPCDDLDAQAYYQNIANTRKHLNLKVEILPKNITPEFVKSINDRPGILALALETMYDRDGNKSFTGVPFVVPGGRFNEMYGWDSYFEALGLIVDGKLDLAKGMVDNFVYEITHYGKILNANRSYYLSRSQPPFLTDMALKVYAQLPTFNQGANKAWLAKVFNTAIKEYETVWTCAPRLDLTTGLSCYHPDGCGIPPETESSHFDHIILPHATKLGLSIQEYTAKYNDGSIKNAQLDEYFLHDRAVRESGHDTTYRFEGKCAHLATIDLNALLYKYEIDIATTIKDIFDDHFEVAYDGMPHDPNGSRADSSTKWFERARKRQEAVSTYCWDEEQGMFFDYNIVEHKRNPYESVTALWALWAHIATDEQAKAFVDKSLHKFEVLGGLVSGTEESRGSISLDRPNRQWDFPFGWAPHQIMAWHGLAQYGYMGEARRLAYRWLFTLTKAFVDFNGVVPEKFDVVSMTHRVHVEYGNVGTDFKFVPREGFGWMNASYQIGLTYMISHMRRGLGTLVSPDKFFTHGQTTNISSAKRQQMEKHAKEITLDGEATAVKTVIKLETGDVMRFKEIVGPETVKEDKQEPAETHPEKMSVLAPSEPSQLQSAPRQPQSKAALAVNWISHPATIQLSVPRGILIIAAFVFSGLSSNTWIGQVILILYLLWESLKWLM